MIYGSVCSGIEAASVAWTPLDWRCAFVSEIEPFARAVLTRHHPEIPLHGDFTTIGKGDYEPIDILVGGTPCQSFSIAGLRGGMDDDRGNLALEFLRLADRLRPTWVLWENVPGVLSSNKGRDFGAFLRGLVECGYGFAYRVLDAQYFGLAQRRKRVFVVGYLGDWRPPAAVLFERASLRGHPAPRREARESVAATTPGCFGKSGRRSLGFGGNRTSGPQEVASALKAHGGPAGHIDFETETFITTVADPITAVESKCYTHEGKNNFRAHNLIAFVQNGRNEVHLDGGGDQASALAARPGVKQRTYVAEVEPVAFALRGREGGAQAEVHESVSALRSADGGSTRDFVAFNVTPSNSNKDYNARATEHAQAVGRSGNRPSARGGDMVAHSLRAEGFDASDNGSGKGTPLAPVQSGVRRLTPTECERLQGFPDGYTAIEYRGKPAADGPRYRALGNSMAVPVMAWLGRRIAMVDIIQKARQIAPIAAE